MNRCTFIDPAGSKRRCGMEAGHWENPETAEGHVFFGPDYEVQLRIAAALEKIAEGLYPFVEVEVRR